MYICIHYNETLVLFFYIKLVATMLVRATNQMALDHSASILSHRMELQKNH